MWILSISQDPKQTALNPYVVERVHLVSLFASKWMHIGKLTSSKIVPGHLGAGFWYVFSIIWGYFVSSLFDVRGPLFTVTYHIGRLKPLLNMLRNPKRWQEKTTHDAQSLLFWRIDFIYYTGDTPPHTVWNQSRTDQLYSLNTINNLLATRFPDKTVYSAVGNHEAGRNCDYSCPPLYSIHCL